MGDFEFLAGFFGILLGLIVAEVASKFAGAIEGRHERPIGLLTPLLAVVVLSDVTSFWLWLWAEQERIQMSWNSVYASTALGIVYYLAAALTFPSQAGRWRTLDEHYWEHKRWVVGGLLLVNAFLITRMMARLLPAWDDWWFYFFQIGYFLPIIGLLFSRRRRVDLALLSWLMIYFAVNLWPDMPQSEWANTTGLNPNVPSTSLPADPK